ncbi:hypothetical protein DEV91_10321 [Phyllobacterium brassicacearum]|nr:hypothetical protein DEV91_10321 [Phyllobacterium brassicacearum]
MPEQLASATPRDTSDLHIGNQSMSSAPLEPKPVHLIVADVWKDKDDEPRQVHLLLMSDDTDNLVNIALQILANEGYDEAELLEIGTLTEEPEEEPHLSAYKNALTGQAALIEFNE